MEKCTVCVASSLSEKTYEYLCLKIKERFGSDIQPVRKNDDSVLGGFILSFGGQVYDMSLSSQLRLLKKHIRGEG